MASADETLDDVREEAELASVFTTAYVLSKKGGPLLQVCIIIKLFYITPSMPVTTEIRQHQVCS